MSIHGVLDELRFPLRTAAFVGLTFGMYGLLEIDTARSPAAARDEVLHTWMRRYGQALLRLYGVEVRAGGPHVGEGRHYPGRDARGRGRLFVMNHRSGVDILVTLALFEATILSRADLAGWPVIGVAARRSGILFVDRSDKRSGAAVIQAMTAAFARGRAVMVYPEGTTFAGDEVRPFRPGAFTAALRAGAEVVPVGIAYEGAEAAYVDESFLDHMKRVSRTRRTVVAVEVGDPISSAPDPDRLGQASAGAADRLGAASAGAADRLGQASAGVLRDAAQAAVQALVHRARAALASADTRRYDAGPPSPSATGHGH